MDARRQRRLLCAFVRYNSTLNPVTQTRDVLASSSSAHIVFLQVNRTLCTTCTETSRLVSGQQRTSRSITCMRHTTDGIHVCGCVHQHLRDYQCRIKRCRADAIYFVWQRNYDLVRMPEQAESYSDGWCVAMFNLTLFRVWYRGVQHHRPISSRGGAGRGHVPCMCVCARLALVTD